VYREYGIETLVVVEYPQTTIFPVSVTVGPGNYTFCIFGKNSTHLDRIPSTAEMEVITELASPPTTEPGIICVVGIISPVQRLH
jgi:hypothetical protein